MRKDVRKILVSIGVAMACVAAIQAAKYFSSQGQEDLLRISSRRIKGNPKAVVKIIEYIDFHCAPCGYGSRWLKDFMQKHPREIFLEVRYFPLHLSQGALSARFAECALRQGKFWEVLDALFQEQAKWVRLADAKSFYLDIARKENMDVKVLEACWDSPKLYDEIMTIKHQGQGLGVSATPTYFINGNMVVGSKALSEELEKLLNVEKNEPKVAE